MEAKIPEEKREMVNKSYRELIGNLIYLANMIKPDISIAIRTLSRYNLNLTLSRY